MSSEPTVSFQKTRNETLLTIVQRFTKYDALKDTPPHTLHPFSSEATEPPVSLLKDLVSAADILAHSLSNYQLFSATDPKLLSLLRQHGALSHDLHAVEQDVRQRLDTLRKRNGIVYAESIPLEQGEIPSWILSRLEQWGKTAGMEIFREQREDHCSIVLGGKALVVDIDFFLNRSVDNHPVLNVATVKTSHALLPQQSLDNVSQSSFTLDDFIKNALLEFTEEVQSKNSTQKTLRATGKAENIQAYFSYIMKLDSLSVSQGDKGTEWFEHVSMATSAFNKLAQSEATTITASLSSAVAPLDIFLLRAHALAMPYLTSPSLSFLVYLSPLAYLTLSRWGNSKKEIGSDFGNSKAFFDIQDAITRSALLSKELKPTGAIIATLTLSNYNVEQSFLTPAISPLPSASNRPTFPLLTVTPPVELEYRFPVPPGVSISNNGVQCWMLDFTDGGKTDGIVMTQSRMREIQLIVNPLAADMQVNIISFGYASWFDLLLSRGSVSAERYTCTYRSQSDTHPPLRLRLLTPVEAGYLLGKVPVRNVKETLAILEVVREQCWLNENLKAYDWKPESPESLQDYPEDNLSTEEKLELLLQGTYSPNAIPVNVYIGYQATTDAIFDSGEQQFIHPGMPQIIMTLETRDSSPSQLQIVVNYDLNRPRGVRVDVSGTLPFTMQQVESLEETARRGGILGLPGKLWTWQ